MVCYSETTKTGLVYRPLARLPRTVAPFPSVCICSVL